MFLQNNKKKIQKNTCEKVDVHVYFSKVLQKLKVISSYIFEIQEQQLSRDNSFFLNKSLKFLKQNIECFEPNKTRLFFLIETQFWKDDKQERR